MSTITIDTAALATIVQELVAEELRGLGSIFLSGRADGIASLQLRLLSLARQPAAAPSLAAHEDVIGPVAWHHQLPAGQQFLDGRSGRVVEGLQEALGHKDRFGGVLAPLFRLASPGDSDSWARETAPAADYDTYADACRARGVLPCSHESFRAAVMAGGLDGQRHRETRMDTGFDGGGELGARQAQEVAKPAGQS